MRFCDKCLIGFYIEQNGSILLKSVFFDNLFILTYVSF